MIMNTNCGAYECVEPQHVLPEVRGMEKKQTDQVNLKTKLLKRTIIYQKRRAIRQGHNTLTPSFATKMAVPENKTRSARKLRNQSYCLVCRILSESASAVAWKYY
jgi:hypothetical protein